MLGQEIQVCVDWITEIKEAEVAKFRAKVSEDSDKINLHQFICESVLNNTPEDRTIYLLGRMNRDPT